MKLKFKKQQYQTNAVDAVIDCFKGQPYTAGMKYRMDTGRMSSAQQTTLFDDAFKNEPLMISSQQILKNIQEVQQRQNLPMSNSVNEFRTIKKDRFVVDKSYTKSALAIAPYHLDVEMETGTGKTYCYIKTCFEMNQKYGWSKFIVVVPSIAIREGVYKSLEITADHFQQEYGRKAKCFIYNSKDLHNLESFSTDAGINIMIINVQAFNSAPAKGASESTILNQKNKIYRELDDFQSRRPIDVIKANRPILIMDEPQKMEGAATTKSLIEFNPLMVIRYSATHKTEHNKIHRLDALDAYNQKLVKKIAVRGISVNGLSGTNSYLYLESIEISRSEPVARVEFEVKRKNGVIKREIRKLRKRDNLYVLSGGLPEYKDRFVVREINAVNDTVEFTNGIVLQAGEATGDVNENALRRIQIRETIRAHLEKEQVLFHQGIKVLSLFFIDEVAKYRKYEDGVAGNGEYADIFEEEYTLALNELGLIDKPEYKKYLDSIDAGRTHNGYFSIDKNGKMIDPKMNRTEIKKGEANDVDAYDLILRKKEELLSFEEPTRFIFSHSALREGWDNPNVFVICTLKHSDNVISRRQEVGRGLRIAVDKFGDRQDDPATVHQTNVLTVVANESYNDFVAGLQRDISDSLSERPRIADEAYFTGKKLKTDKGLVDVTPQMAKQIYRYLLKNDYTDDNDRISQTYLEAVKNRELAALPPELHEYRDQVYDLIDSVYNDDKLPQIENDRSPKKNPLNDNFEKKEFKELWSRINKKAVFNVNFDSGELIEKCVKNMNAELRVTPLTYTVQSGIQRDQLDYDQLKSKSGFKKGEHTPERGVTSASSVVKYDLIGKICESVLLTRKTIVAILKGLNAPTFGQFRRNPESFISEASRLINEQKATMIIEHLSYDTLSETFDSDIFTDNQSNQDFSKVGEKLKRHIYDYVVTDSKIERDFVEELDTSSEVVVYAKLPRGFHIPTPVGNYNPDWAIAFKEGSVKHIYFVAETKGSMSTMDLKQTEITKIECARKFFSKINEKIAVDNVKYDVVNSYGKLMDIVGSGE